MRRRWTEANKNFIFERGIIMGKDNLNESHSVSNETVVEQVVNSALDTGTQNTNQHECKVSDSSGNSGHGSGRSESEARGNARDDYYGKQ